MGRHSDIAIYGREIREAKRERRALLGVECPQCKIARPKTNASILLPGQRCKVDGYLDPRSRKDFSHASE
jgi:hypothetical protein